MKKTNTWGAEISRNLPHLKIINLPPVKDKLILMPRWIKPVVRVVG